MTDANATPDPLRGEFLRLAAAAPLWTPPAEPLLIPPPEAEEDQTPAAKEGRGAARLLPMLAACPLLIDPHGQTYILVEGDLYPLDSKAPLLVETASDLYYRATGEAQTMGKDALAAAVAVLSRRARIAGQLAPMANRATPWGDALLYDLGNRRAARIAAGSWQVVPTPPGAFRPWPHKLPHPEPLPGGDASRLFGFVNVAEDDRLLVLCTMAACMVPGTARPALIATGSQGSGKSTFARFLKMILDPGTPALTMLTRKPEDLDLLLCRNAFLALDNLSSLPPDVADTLAAIITGATPQRRKLHTDSELATLHADVTLCLTSINALSSRPDFLERTLRIQLDRIEDGDRLADDELDTAFADALPEILGGLLDMLARGLELQPRYRPPRLPRMASFARIAAAIAEAAEEGGGGRYLAAYFRNQGAQHLELAEGDLFFGAILEACQAGNHPSGTFKQVCATLKELADPGPKDPFPGPRGLRGALERLRVPLQTAGIGFRFDNHRTATAKATVSFFTVSRSEDLATAEPPENTAPLPPEPPDLGGLVFDPGELDP
ncbi:hypothetical protein JCM30471_27420 [Desulfuromonas carbonis]